MKFTAVLTFLLSLIFQENYAQVDLLKEIDTTKTTEVYQPSFKALQIVTAQSTKLPAKKEFYLIISHRFGDISDGFENFFGLDNATTKIGGIYGITDAIAVSLSRHTYQKTFEFGGKIRLIKQEGDMPLELAGYHVFSINSELKKEVYPKLKFSDRLNYVSELLISRRFSEKFSMQLTPSYVSKNLVDANIEKNSQFLTGIGGRYKISRRVSLNAEYFYNFNSNSTYKNPLSLGLDIDTGGHIFQLLFTNSQPITEAGYLTNATGNWGKGKIFFGFNLYRVF